MAPGCAGEAGLMTEESDKCGRQECSWQNGADTLPVGQRSHHTDILKIQIKSLLLSHHHSTSALVSEIGEWNSYERAPDSAKKTTDNLHMDRQCKKNNRQFTYGQTVQKNCTGAFTVLQTVQKKQQQFTYGQYIFTDCTEDNVQNTHILSTHSVL